MFSWFFLYKLNYDVFTFVVVPVASVVVCVGGTNDADEDADKVGFKLLLDTTTIGLTGPGIYWASDKPDVATVRFVCNIEVLFYA